MNRPEEEGMDRSVSSSQSQSNPNQNKALIQSNTDPSVSGRQQNRFNSSRRRNDFVNKNISKFASNATQRQSSQRGGRPRGSGSGSVANSVNCDLWGDHLNGEQSLSLGDKSDKKAFGSKKHNLNHLLNFTFDSRDHMIEQRGARRGQQRMARFMPKYNKEHFLQANCQFVVNDLNDYSKHSSDPDCSIDWNSIEEIRFNSLTAETYCPICLDTPLAPKITRCGHIYCWSCVLHYLALSDHKWRKCPICFDSIQSIDLKTVTSVNKIDYKVGDFITLCLMKRKKGSTIASPVLLYDSNQNCSNQKFEPLDGDSVISSYQKIVIASPNQILSQIIDRERKQLMKQMIADKDTPEVCFIENALDQLKEREQTICKRYEDSLLKDIDIAVETIKKDSDEDFYYFYQSEDGQHIYLHSLNVRLLKQEFGSLENCPQKICAKIIETEWDSMSEENRKRYRYLQHLPLTCEFRIVELEFTNQLISDKTLDLFLPEIIKRQKMRAKRDREERRRERHIQVEQNKRIHGIYPRPKYQLDNKEQFPSCSDPTDGLRAVSPFNSSESSIVEDLALNNSCDNLMAATYGNSPNEPEFPSFAAMLRQGKAKPTLDFRKERNRKDAVIDETNESGDEYHRPSYNYSLSDAFTAALQMKSSGEQREQSEIKKGSKKKKNKPKLLMSTAMKRSY